ncbi:hypothetical protein PCE1_001489 [Barthelona sp. PCE]
MEGYEYGGINEDSSTDRLYSIVFCLNTLIDVFVCSLTYFCIFICIVLEKSLLSMTNMYVALFISIIVSLPLVFGIYKCMKTEVVMPQTGVEVSIVMDLYTLFILITCCIYGSKRTALVICLILNALLGIAYPSFRYSMSSMSRNKGEELIANLKAERPIIKHGFCIGYGKFHEFEEFVFDSWEDHTELIDIPTASPLYLLRIFTKFEAGDSMTADVQKFHLNRIEEEYTGDDAHQADWVARQRSSLLGNKCVKYFLVVNTPNNVGFVSLKWALFMLLAPCDLWYTSRIACTAGVLQISIKKKYYCHEDSHH